MSAQHLQCPISFLLSPSHAAIFCLPLSVVSLGSVLSKMAGVVIGSAAELTVVVLPWYSCSGTKYVDPSLWVKTVNRLATGAVCIQVVAGEGLISILFPSGSTWISMLLFFGISGGRAFLRLQTMLLVKSGGKGFFSSSTIDLPMSISTPAGFRPLVMTLRFRNACEGTIVLN